MSDWVWGVDVASQRVDVAMLDTNRRIEHRSVHVGTNAKGARRLDLLHHVLMENVWGWAHYFPPIMVWVEEPFFKGQAPILMQAVGVTMQALYRGLEAIWDTHAVPVEPIATGAWKKAAVGHGNASKEQVMAWAKTFGYEGADQNAADALGVAVAGKSLVRWGS